MDSGTPHFRKCFYVGGRYQDSSSKSGKASQIMVEQMYVEELRPLTPRNTLPIVFWHGMGQTGSGWVTTPDGRPGWASYFLSRGHTVYVIDIPERGRSAWLPESSKLISVPVDYAEDFWTSTGKNGQIWPQAHLHTQWPGTGRKGDPVFDSFMASQIQARTDYELVETLAKEAGSKLLRKIGPAILCTHSSGGSHGWVIADTVPDLVKAIVALEPVGPPFVNRVASVLKKVDPEETKRPYGLSIVPLTYSPPLSNGEQLATSMTPSQNPDFCDSILQKDPPRRLANLSGIPTLVVTSESGYHAHYDHATVAYLKQAGVDVTWLNLPEVDVRGNGHFMFLEENSIEIAEHVYEWLAHNSLS